MIKLNLRFLPRLILHCFAFQAALFSLQSLPASAAEQSRFVGAGPFSVSIQSVENQGLLLMPAGTSSAANKRWPAVVFAHGLCGPAEKYAASLTRLASWGFMVLASQQQSDCGVMNLNRPMATLGNLFRLPTKFGNAVDFSAMGNTIRSNLGYLSGRSDVDTSRLALMGHSMGGGMVIDVASELAEEQPDLVKAVVAIAPWNGVQPTPSTVVQNIHHPLLIVCSMSDALCPCSGEVQLSDTQGILTGNVSLGIPLLFGPSEDSTWHGGAMAIFNNAKEAILMDVSKVSHFTIAGIDGGAEMQTFADWATRQSGLNFNRPDRAYTDIPTMEYSIAFLNLALDLDPQAGRAFLDGASSDSRLVRTLRSQ